MMRETNTIKDSTGRITTYAYNSNVDLTSISNTNNEQTGFGKNSSFLSIFLEENTVGSGKFCFQPETGNDTKVRRINVYITKINGGRLTRLRFGQLRSERE
jgi:hypothetical protein